MPSSAWSRGQAQDEHSGEEKGGPSRWAALFPGPDVVSTCMWPQGQLLALGLSRQQ